MDPGSQQSAAVAVDNRTGMPSLLADPASTVGTCILVETDAAVAFPGAFVDASLPTPAPWPTSSRHAPPPGSHPTTDPDRSESERRSPPQTNHSERTSRLQTLFAPPRVRGRYHPFPHRTKQLRPQQRDVVDQRLTVVPLPAKTGIPQHLPKGPMLVHQLVQAIPVAVETLLQHCQHQHSTSCVKNLLQFLVGAETRPYGRVSARREIFGRFMPPPAMSRIPVRMREPRRSGHIDNAAPSATAHGSPPQVPRSDADRTPRSGRS